ELRSQPVNPAAPASAREPRDPLRIPHPAGGLDSAAKSSHCHGLILSFWSPERNRRGNIFLYTLRVWRLQKAGKNDPLRPQVRVFATPRAFLFFTPTSLC